MLQRRHDEPGHEQRHRTRELDDDGRPRDAERRRQTVPREAARDAEHVGRVHERMQRVHEEDEGHDDANEVDAASVVVGHGPPPVGQRSRHHRHPREAP